MRIFEHLHPLLQARMNRVIEICDTLGYELGIGECLRTITEQNALYAQGRTEPGRIVTYAPGSSYSSQHQWGVAVDFFKNVKGHEYDDAAFFKSVADIAKACGLAWGGDWDDFQDTPHLYLPEWGDTPSELKRLYGSPAQFMKTWKTLKVDGSWGERTTIRLQMFFGMKPDGIISRQYAEYKDENPGLSSGWEWQPDPTYGSWTILHLQEWLNKSYNAGLILDGFIGPKTISALSEAFGIEPDGTLSKNSPTIRALQKYLNMLG